MKTVIQDRILNEVRQNRRSMEQQYGNNIAELVKGLQKYQSKFQDRLIDPRSEKVKDSRNVV